MNDQILEQQRRSWNKFSDGWQKWDEVLKSGMRTVTDEFIEVLQLKGDEKILDVASGTGEPGLSIGLKLPNGRVMGADLSEKMVGFANKNAKHRNIENYHNLVSDASNLPFDDNSFDHVASRFGIMFFPDMNRGLKEMKRVLKPGGKIALAVWAAPQLNPLITLLAMTVMEKLGLPKPSPEAPGIFRCAEPGKMKNLMMEVGLKEVTEKNIKVESHFESPNQYWDVFSDVAGPVMQALDKEPPEVVREIKASVIKKAEKFVKNGEMTVPGEAILLTGIKS